MQRCCHQSPGRRTGSRVTNVSTSLATQRLQRGVLVGASAGNPASFTMTSRAWRTEHWCISAMSSRVRSGRLVGVIAARLPRLVPNQMRYRPKGLRCRGGLGSMGSGSHASAASLCAGRPSMTARATITRPAMLR